MRGGGQLRLTLGIALLLIAFLPSALALEEWLRIRAVTEEQMAALVQTSAYEDVFGFGFWVSWGVLAVAEAIFVAGAWWLLAPRWNRPAAATAWSLFAVASLLLYAANEREEALWVKHVHQAARQHAT